MKEHPVFHKVPQSSSGFRPMTRIAVPAPRPQGFTLVEMAITLAVGGILLALALPSFTESRANGKIRAAAAQMQQDLQWARAEAIKRNGRVRVTTSASIDCADAVWRVAWIKPDGLEETLRCHTRGTYGQQFAHVNFAANQVTISFSSLGTASAGVTYTFSYDNSSVSQRQWQVVSGTGGRISSSIVSGT